MKVIPRTDYPVRVRPMSAGVPAAVAGLYEGIYEVTLNNVVDIAFVPSLSGIAPPFRDDLLPRDVDEITTPAQARLVGILFSPYGVTPNDALKGQRQRLSADRLVSYVAEAEFENYSADLHELSTRLGDLHSGVTVTTLTDHAVIRFLRDTLVPMLDPADLAMLKDGTAGAI